MKRNDAAPALRTLFWEATLACNAFCAFCGSRCGEPAPEPLSGEWIRKALRETAQAFDAREIMINVTGGEPLLRRDLFEIMREAHALGFPWGMVTNGTLITPEVVEQMRQTGMRTISISLDGPEELHERIRRLPGGFARIRRAIALLKEADFLDELQITTVVNRENLSQLEALLILLKDWGADSWRIATVDPIGRARGQEQLLLRPEDRLQVLAFLDEHAFDADLRVTTSCSHYLGASDALYRPHPFHCEAGKHVASILANGDLFVCPNVERRPEWMQGNVRTHNLPEVWRDGYACFRDAQYRRRGACAHCTQWDRCRGDSLHTWDEDRGEPRICWLQTEPKAPGSARLPETVLAAIRQSAPALRGVRFSYGSTSARCVYLSPDAAREMITAFAWGRRHPRNQCEQMAALFGWRWEDCALAAFLAPTPLDARGAETAAVSQRGLDAAKEELAILRHWLPLSDARFRLSERPVELLGYLHTHPGDLDFALSHPDLALFDRLRREDDLPLFLLANPQTRQLCAYWDSAFVPTDTEVLLDAAEVAAFLGETK